MKNSFNWMGILMKKSNVFIGTVKQCKDFYWYERREKIILKEILLLDIQHSEECVVM